MKTHWSKVQLVDIRTGEQVTGAVLIKLHLDLFRNIGWSVGVVFKIADLNRPDRVMDVDWEGF